MSETEINSAETTPETKPKRRYVRKEKSIAPATPAIPVAEVPNPAILALQEDILGLVKQRGSAQHEIAQAGLALNQASARMQGAREILQQLESEVQYRMSLISQMRGGGPPPIQVPAQYYPPTLHDVYAPQIGVPPGVGSIPSVIPFASPADPGGRRIRSESAEDVRSAI